MEHHTAPPFRRIFTKNGSLQSVMGNLTRQPYEGFMLFTPKVRQALLDPLEGSLSP